MSILAHTTGPGGGDSEKREKNVNAHGGLTRIRRKKISSNPDRAVYVSAMHWRELTTSSGPFSAKKLS